MEEKISEYVMWTKKGAPATVEENSDVPTSQAEIQQAS